VIVFFTRVKIYTKIESQNKILVQHIVELDKNESLRTAIQKRDDFISLTSHELKTPLTALKLQIQLINSPVMRQNLEPKIINLLKEADKQIDRVNGLVSDLLDLSKISHDKLELRIEKIDLFDLLQDIVSRFSKTIDSNLSIEFSNHQYATGCWDRLRIEQVMNNLLTNAAKYGLGRPIKVYADATEKEVQIQVRDFGIGIAVEDQVRIFGRFERAVGTNAVFGLGLGLYISQKIVHAHQGTIYVTSSLNDGATFFVRLPKTLCQDRGSPLVA
jgi:signal transduction histidine kinase